ncbi:MAG: dihydrofolate reductase [Alphaproteobacteria bacterium]|nr:dihydrofolate reductase [Alphaproteobacteria bacterium]
MDINIVVAVAANGVIGREGGMPWRLSTDLKRFKAITMGRPVIMGRKTFHSIGKALPGRTNIVVTRDDSFAADGVQVAHSVEAALRLGQSIAKREGADAVCVIGGGEIYQQAFGHADRVFLTHVESAPDGDTRFPALDPAEWQMEQEENIPAGPKDSAATRYAVYRRK